MFRSLCWLLNSPYLPIYLQPGYFESIGLFLSSYVIPRTSGGEAAAMAAYSTISNQYQFVKEDENSNIIDIVATKKARSNSSGSAKSTSSSSRRGQEHVSQDLDEAEWVEMSAKDADAAAVVSVKPQDALKSDL